MGDRLWRSVGGALVLAALLWTAAGFRPADPDWFRQGEKLAEANGGAWFVVYGDGTLSAWGDGRSGALGDSPRGGEFFRPYGLRRTVLTGVQELRSDGGTLILAIDRAGTLWSVGARTTLIRSDPAAGPDAPAVLMEDVADAAVGPNTLAAVGRDGALYLWQDGGPVQVGTGSVRVFFAGGCLFTLQEDGALLRWDGADSRPVPISGPAVEVAGAGDGVLILLEDGTCLAAEAGPEGLLSPAPITGGVAGLCRDGLWKEDGRLYHARIADGVLTLEPAAEGVAAAVSPRCCLTEDGVLRTARGEIDLRTAGPVRWAVLVLAAAAGLPLAAGWRPRTGRAG